MPPVEQNYSNHIRYVPPYLAALGVLTLNLGWTIWRLIAAPSMDTAMGAAMAVTLIAIGLYARNFALTVQDRVIRLEMRLRLRELLPASMHARIHEFTRGQLVAMRFASDAELPALAEQVLRDKIQDRKAIKQAIKQWTPDNLRA